jgi:hypothetical protein
MYRILELIVNFYQMYQFKNGSFGMVDHGGMLVWVPRAILFGEDFLTFLQLLSPAHRL